MKPVKVKSSDKLIQILKSKFFLPISFIDVPSISMDDMKKMGLNGESDIYEIGIFRLVKSSSFLGGKSFKLELTSNDLDFDGGKTENNTSLLKYLQGEYRRKNLTIKAKDLRDFNVNTRRSELTVGNFKLTESLLGGINSLLEGKMEKSYDLGLADKRFGSDNKIVNSKVTFKEIQRILNGFVISQSDYENNGEVAINKMLEAYFQGHFENASRSGGAKKSYYDLIIGDPEKNEGFAVELKLASSLANNAGQRQRASGQVKEYVKNLKNNNLILLIIGPKTEYSNKNIKSLEEEIESDYNCYFVYHSVK